MAHPESNSPAASSTLLPFLGGRSRRGSLASISSKRGIDKDVLAQALDEIHTTASRTDGLTSFHDFDGEGSRGGAKDLVSNGVSGLYNRLKQSVGGASASKDYSGKARPKSSESKDSFDTPSLASTSSPTATRPTASVANTKKSVSHPPADTQSMALLSVPASPAVRSCSSYESAEVSAVSSGPKLHTADREHISARGSSDHLHDAPVEEMKLGEQKPIPRPLRSGSEAPTKADIDKARNAWASNDKSDLAIDALARVLSHHEVSVTDQPQQSSRIGNRELAEAIDDSDSADVNDEDSITDRSHLPLSGSALQQGQIQPIASKALERPPMIRVGPSHLPGFDPSRATSTMDGSSATSVSSTRTASKAPALAPSPNINAALQRRRTGLKPQPASATSLSLSNHLKRRVLSKEFWMKDDNARVCFSCGQAFSTFRRKHHCRTCGQIFDAKCTSLVAGRPFGQPSTVRLCKPCESIIFGSDDDSSVFSDDDRDDYTRSPLSQNLLVSKEAMLNRFEGPAFSRTDTEVTTPSIGIPVSRRNREAKRRSAVIEFDNAPTLARPSSSHSLASLSRRPRSSSHRRRHSRHQPARHTHSSFDAERAPFHHQAGDEDQGQLPTFHNDNIIDPDLAAFLSDEGSDEDEMPNILSAVEGHAASPGEREKLGFSSLFTSAIRKGRSRGTDKRLAPSSSIQGVRGDDIRNASKVARHRNLSDGSTKRPSPRRSHSNLLLNTIQSEPTDKGRPLSPTMNANATRAKVVRSSALKRKRGDDLELYPASYEHVKKLLAQLLGDSKVPQPNSWQKALLPILMQCTDDVTPDVQQGDDMDIRHYIKLKKIPGGRPADTAYVSGIVFSKNVALKTMARNISNPRILIIGFSIEYARYERHFMSLEPVIAQEAEFLQNLVNRIAALRPTVLLVQKHVSGRALELLQDAGITVVYNIKESVLAAVARVTRTIIVKTIDKLSIDAGLLGICDSFEVKTFVSEGHRKTYIYLSGCAPDLGCTVILRGADTKTLRLVKRIAEFMCYVAYNLKLENYLMRDEFVSLPHTVEGQIAAHESAANGITHPDERQQTINETLAQEVGSGNAGHHFKYEAQEQEARKRLLSASPFVVFMQPYILTQLRDMERRLATYKMLRDQYAAADEEGDEAADEEDALATIDHFSLVQPDMVNAPASKDQPKAVREYLHAVHEAQLEKAKYIYENQERQWDAFINGPLDPFDPFSHQKIIVLYSTVSSITSAPCTGPALLGMEFYASLNRAHDDHDEDLTLGQYIEDMCITANEMCDVCNKKHSDHHRQYTHGYGRLSISVQRQSARMRGLSHSILMWSTCRQCRHETTVTQMSDLTWKYSFAKYLELSFWSSHLHPRAGLCKHDIHRDFYRCFGWRDLVIRVAYDPIDIYDIVVPRAQVTWKVEADLRMKNEQYEHFEQRLNAFTGSVRKRLDSIHIDALEEKTALEAQALVDALRDRLERDEQELKEKLQLKYASSRYYEVIPLNRALRFMDEKAISWDEEFSRFEDKYFPSEADIRKIAVNQLKNMFIESQPPRSEGGSEPASDTEDGTEMTAVRRKSTARVELLSEKHAQHVLLNGMEEPRSDVSDVATLQPVPSNESQALMGNGLVRVSTPRKDLEEVVEREDVRHLDLAVPAQSPPHITVGDRLDEASPRPGRQLSSDTDAHTDEPFATQPKPLSSGLLERIEQIRNNRAAAGMEPDSAESKIPRLADLQQKKRDASPLNNARPVPPPLLRAKSQPGHPGYAHHPSADSTADLSIDAVAANTPPQEAPQVEKRINERLGVSRLANKIGKVAPSLIPRSIPIKHDEGSHFSTVSALAKHFEQMSREFEKERLKERRQRAMRSRQARANPLASSKPTVEVYQNATDAVGERDASSHERDAKADNIARQHMDEIVAESQPEDNPVTETLSRPGTSSAPDTTGEPPHSSEVCAVGGTETEADAETASIEQPPSRSRDVSDPSSSLQSPTASGPDLPEFSPDLTIPEHKKNVWFKYLSEFWSKRSASGWVNLEYPLHANEHVFEDSDIIVREDEPSSVIAIALACADYRAKEKEFRTAPNRNPLAKQAHSHHTSTASAAMSKDEIKREDIEASLLGQEATHMKYSFSHGQVKASCKIFYAESFDALRRRCGVADRFMESMSRCLKFDSKGGKTKSLFLRTLDSRFIIKSLQEVELKAFTKFAPDYFNFMSYTLFHGVPSVIAKMFGLFQVNIRNPATGVDFSYFLLVMENLFYEKDPNRRFDLKGSMRNRKIESTGQADEVLLDENLVETIFESPLFVREHSRKLLQASVFNDTLWLCKQNVMDYSLMAGFDDARKELVVGIIDCIRTYTWDKKLESWIKDRGKNKPTITSPKDYRNRFRVSMMQYVLQAPNCWHQFQAQMAPPKTLNDQEREDGGVGTGNEDTEVERERT